MILGMHTALVNDFHLETIHAEQLYSYYVLHWELQHLKSNLVENENVVVHNGVIYIPIFKGDVISCMNPKQQVRLSFRETRWDSEMPNYVLIKKLGT